MTHNEVARHWIGAEWVDSPHHRQSINPATGEVIGVYADGGVAEAGAAIAAARTAFIDTTWRKDRALRSRVLNELADLFETHFQELSRLLTLENGKVRGEADFEMSLVAPKLRYYAALALTDAGRALQARPGRFSIVLREPAGVAGLIVPWNSPVILLVRSLAPALAAGATAVVKMPAQTAQVNAKIAEVIAQAPSLPTGVVNIFTEHGSEGARLIVESPDVPVISFTGSTATGRMISAAAAKQLKAVGNELGGKTPIVVFDDADVNALLPVLEKAVTVFAGQFCMTGSRLLVQRGIADKVRDGISARLERVRVGPGSDPASDMGPMIDKQNVERVDNIVRDAIASGARSIVRGGPVSDGPLAGGAFYRPTLLEVSGDMPIVAQEVFGPVLVMQVFDTEAEAIQLANATEYGLAASVWSRDADRPLRVASEIDAGTVWINEWASVLDEFEEGGFKQSGVGRLNGVAALELFLESKHITQNVSGRISEQS